MSAADFYSWRAGDPIRVWAPRAADIALLLPADPTNPAAGSERIAMERIPGQDHWYISERGLPDWCNYGFAITPREPYPSAPNLTPDPRSAWQPYGPHGPSRTFDASTFAWSDQDFAGIDARGAIHYELHVGAFTREATLISAIDRLEHLADLGVDMIELMPLAEFPGARGWGYDGVGPYSVHHAYGGPEALCAFVNAAHRLGMGVALDCVYNHLGPDGNYTGVFGPYFTDKYHTPWGTALNVEGEEARPVRRWVIESALRFFADFHIDELRLDAVHAIYDASETHILAELAQATADLSDTLGRPLSLVAESDENQPRTITETHAGGRGMTAQWDDDIHHAIHVFFTGETSGYYSDFSADGALATTMENIFFHAGTYSSFREKVWGSPVPDHIGYNRFVVCDQNHDQIGNRAAGDRPIGVTGPGGAAASLALIMLSPYTPMLFMGQEWGAATPFQFFTEHAEPLGAAVTAGRREEFSRHGWDPTTIPDPQAEHTAKASTLDWDELNSREQARSYLDFVRQLIALRKEIGGSNASDGTEITRGHAGSHTYAVRQLGDVVVMRRESLLVIASRTAGPHDIELELTTPDSDSPAVQIRESDSGAARIYAYADGGAHMELAFAAECTAVSGDGRYRLGFTGPGVAIVRLG